MTDLITFPDKNGKLAVYTGGNICGLYCHLEMIRSPTTFTTSINRSLHYVTSSSTYIDTEKPQPFIAALCIL